MFDRRSHRVRQAIPTTLVVGLGFVQLSSFLSILLQHGMASTPKGLIFVPLIFLSLPVVLACGGLSRDFEVDAQITYGGYPHHSLAACVLASSPSKTPQLVTALRSLVRHVLPSNPADVLVFHTGEYSYYEIQARVRVSVDYNITFLQIPASSWQIPRGLHKADSFGGHGIGYKHMCRWYSKTFFQYLNVSGYKWALRFDQDSVFLSSIDFGLVESMVKNKQQYGYRVWGVDHLEVVWGLPEITSYFLKEQNIQPKWLFNMCSPKSTDGLKTARDGTGWNRQIVYNNFFVTNISFWLDVQVQRYLRLLETTGGFYKFRWGDAPVHTMVIGMFLDEVQLERFSFDYDHQRVFSGNSCKNHSLFQLWC